MRSSKRISLIIFVGVIIAILLALLTFEKGNEVVKLGDKPQSTRLLADSTVTTYDLSETSTDKVTGTLNTETGVLTISGTGAMKSVVNTVSEEDRTKITSITIGTGITTIPEKCFYNLPNVTVISVPNTVTSIGDRAFSFCIKLENINVNSNNQVYKSVDGILYNKSGVWLICYPAGRTAETFSIPNQSPTNVTKICIGAFEGSRYLQEILDFGNVITIDNYAFYSCVKLKKVTTPATITSLGEYAFSWCTSLKEVKFLGKLTIKQYCFCRCSSLKSIIFPESDEEWDLGIQCFGECAKIKKIENPVKGTHTAVDGMMMYRFNGSKYTVYGTADDEYLYASFPKVIMLGGFDNYYSSRNSTVSCTWNVSDSTDNIDVKIKLEDLSKAYIQMQPFKVAQSGTEYGSHFMGLKIVFKITGTDVQEITIEEPTKTDYIIGEAVDLSGLKVYAHYDDGRIDEVTNESDISIADGTVYSSSGTKTVTVTYAGETESFDINVEPRIETYDLSLTTDDDVRGTLNFETGLFTISGTGKMKSVVNTVPVADQASIKKVVIQEGVTSIASQAFYNLSNVTEVSIPASVTSIGDRAFSACHKLENIYVSADNENFSSEDGILYNKSGLWLICYPAGKTQESFSMPDKVAQINPGAFEGNGYLKEITSFGRVTTVKEYAFYNCTALEKIVIPETFTSIGQYAFAYCTNVKEIVISKYIQIPAYCFYHNTLLEIIRFPAVSNSWTLGDHSFAECTHLKLIENPVKGKRGDYKVYGGTTGTYPEDPTMVFDGSVYTAYGTTDERYLNVTLQSALFDSIYPTHYCQTYKCTASKSAGLQVKVLLENMDSAYVKSTNYKHRETATYDSTTLYYNYNQASNFYGLKFRFKEIETTGMEIELPTKVDYDFGDELDLTGLKVYETFNNLQKEEVTDYTISMANGTILTTGGAQEITVSYKGYEETFTIYVRSDDPSQLVHMKFKDPNLYSRAISAIGTDHIISQDDTNLTIDTYKMYVDYVSVFDASDLGIKDLTGIQYFTQLTELYLNRNQICDIWPLAGLEKLEKLQLINNKISDIRALALLDNLTNLNLNSNCIADDTVIYSLENLIDVSINNQRLVVYTNQDEVELPPIFVHAHKREDTNNVLLKNTNCELLCDDNNNKITAILINGFYNNPPARVKMERYSEEQGNDFAWGTSITIFRRPEDITAINILQQPNKTVYYEGESFNPAGMIVEVTYDGTDTAIIKDYNISVNDPLTLNDTTVTISYGDASTTLNIEVMPRVLDRIEVETSDEFRLAYIEGEDLDLSGMTVKAIYEGGDSVILEKKTNTQNGYVTNPEEGTEVEMGLTQIEVSYTEGDITKTDIITLGTEGGENEDPKPPVTPKELLRIEVETDDNFKKAYVEEEELDLSGMTVKAVYSNGKSIVLNKKTDTVNGYVTNPEEGTQVTLDLTQIEVSYTEGEVTKTAIVALGIEGGEGEEPKPPVTKKRLDRIEVTTSDDFKKTYFEEEELDLTGMTVTAYYNNGKSVVLNKKTDTENGYVTNPEEGTEVTIDLTQIEVSYTEDDVTKTAFIILGSDGGEGGDPRPPVIKKELDRIEVETSDDFKKAYVEGEELDLTGMTVTAYYNNGNSAIVENYTTNPEEGTEVAIDLTQIEVSYTEDEVTKTAIVELGIEGGEGEDPRPPVTKKELDRIEVVTNDDFKKEYIEGEELDLTGMTVTAYYNNGKSAVVENYTTNPEEGTEVALDLTQIEVSYTEDEVTRTAIVALGIEGGNGEDPKPPVVKKELDRIEVETSDDFKKEYVEGEELDLTGMTVTAYYNNGKSAVVENYTTNPEEGTEVALDLTQIEVSYTEDEVTRTAIVALGIEGGNGEDPKPPVVKKELDRIEVETSDDFKKEYVEGEELDLTGMTVIAYYNNGKSAVVENYTTNPEEGTEVTLDLAQIEVSYTEDEKTCTAIVALGADGGEGGDPRPPVTKKELDRIEVITNDDFKKEYIEGEELDLTGMTVIAYYNNGKSATVENYTTNPEEGTEVTLDLRNVEVSYTEDEVTKTAIVALGIEGGNGEDPKPPVVKKELDRIEVVTNEDFKKEYIEGEELDLSGMTVTAYYNNGKNAVVENYTTNPEEGTEVTLDLRNIEVSYTEDDITKTAIVTFGTEGEGDNDVIIRKKELAGLLITQDPDKLEYYEGDVFDPSGMVVTAIYNNGTTNVIGDEEGEEYTITPDGPLSMEDTVIIVSYTEDDITKDATLNIGKKVIVHKLEVVRIEVTKEPYKIEYEYGETFDPEGMIVTAYYNNGSSQRITDYELNPNTTYPLIPRVTEITISYEGQETTQPITVYPATVRLTSIEVTEQPYKTVYYEGEPFKKEGLVVVAHYSDGDMKTVTDYEIYPDRDLALGDTEIVINYEDNGIIKRTTLPITVKPIPEDELYIYTDKYEEVEVDGVFYLEGIQPDTPVQDVVDLIRTNGRMRVYYRNDNVVSDYETLTATEMKIVFTKAGETKVYILVVRGDVNRDGKANFTDMLHINKHRLRKVLLEGGCLRAGNVNSDFAADFSDMLKINKYRLGKIKAL